MPWLRLTKSALAVVVLFLLISAATVRAQSTNWNSYRATMWVSDSAYRDPARVPLFFQRLREMGVNSVTYHPGEDLNRIVTNGFGFYVENIVNRGLCLKFSSKVTDWDKFVTDWTRNGRPQSALIRDYSLDDPQWRRYAQKQIEEAVSLTRGRAPFAYDIRDELSVTISANPFDYDFGPITLAHFRDWLRAQYKEIDALNTKWETRFKDWDEVIPFTTDQIKNRMSSGEALPHGNPDWQTLRELKFSSAEGSKSPTRWNFSPWVDFRTYMDISLADALKQIRSDTRKLDPDTPVGIEGTQMPSAWGGYDLWRLSQVLDWVEPYDIGNAREIFGSFMPGKPVVTTVFEKDTNNARRRLWHLLLEGDRGCLVWWSEDSIDWKSPDYALTAKAKALAPVLQEMTSPLAGLLMRAQPESDPIAIHYSQSSIQVDWLLESTLDGPSWHRRFSSFESDHNKMAQIRNGWLKAFQDLGYSPQFVSTEQIERGELNRFKVLVLPHSLALSDKESAEMRKFLAREGGSTRIFADSTPAFDEHGKIRNSPALPFTLEKEVLALSKEAENRAPLDPAAYARERLNSNGPGALADWIAAHIPKTPLPVQISPSARIRVHHSRLGNLRLAALERNINYQMSEELKQAGGNKELEKPITIEIRFPDPIHVYDLVKKIDLGHTDHLSITIDPWMPTILAMAPNKADLMPLQKQ